MEMSSRHMHLKGNSKQRRKQRREIERSGLVVIKYSGGAGQVLVRRKEKKYD
jgi:hypothetical protein